MSSVTDETRSKFCVNRILPRDSSIVRARSGTTTVMASDKSHNRLCFECVGEPFLRFEIKQDGAESICSYCGVKRKSLSLDEVADKVERVFTDHFYKTATEPSGMEYMAAKEGEKDWERPGQPVIELIEELARIELEPAQDLQEILEDRHSDFELAKTGEEQEYDADSQYAMLDVDTIGTHAEWTRFEKVLKTEERYFSKTAEETLSRIFEGIANRITLEGNPVVVKAGPGQAIEALFRARVFQSDELLTEALKRPDLSIGPPPSQVAATGRMNAHGISVFYGALEPATALAEVRPPVGSKVAVARFELLREMLLLDVRLLHALSESRSLFDPLSKSNRERAEFLKWLGRRIAMPVMPSDEPFEYLPTQAVADFLSMKANPPLDGIIYPSVQAGKVELNVVLFHNASRVEVMHVPEGTKIDAELYDFDYDDNSAWLAPTVVEEVPSETPPPVNTVRLEPEGSATPQNPSFDSTRGYDPRVPALKIDATKVWVHAIRAVKFESDSHLVSRSQYKRRKAGEEPF
jgi:hypothetical protein